jgi:hypothetical protein
MNKHQLAFMTLNLAQTISNEIGSATFIAADGHEAPYEYVLANRNDLYALIKSTLEKIEKEPIFIDLGCLKD